MTGVVGLNKEIKRQANRSETDVHPRRLDTHLHDDGYAVLCKNSGCELRASVRFTLLPATPLEKKNLSETRSHLKFEAKSAIAGAPP